MKVVSVDPAPAKRAVVFDGEFHCVPARELPAYCAQLATHGDTLLCWDAPLTGPPSTEHENTFDATYSQRVIERFFSRAGDFKTPKGISVLPFSGCPHWAISRASVGYPRVGRFDECLDNLPFRLVCDTSFERKKGKWIVETHPAIAIWLWCQNTEKRGDNRSWVYKGKKPSRSVKDLWDDLRRVWDAAGIRAVTDVVTKMDVPNDDDKLDAVVGWVLGMMLVHKSPSVTVLGTLSTGAIALPDFDSLVFQFNKFVGKEKGTF